MSLYENLQDRLENVRTYSDYFMASCVFHTDNHPSLMIHEDGYKCLSCGAKGSLKRLEQKIGSYYRPQHYTVSGILPNWRRWEFEYGDLQGIAEHAHKTLLQFPQFQGFIKKRKYEKFIQQGYFGYIGGWWCFPVLDMAGKLVDIVVRAVKGKGDSRYVVKPNRDGTRPLYSPNWERVKNSSYIYIPFGIFDAWAFESIGEPCVTGITGQSMDIEKIRSIGKRGIFVPDLGEAETAHRLANQLGWKYRVKELDYPETVKDPDELRRFYGESALLGLLG